MTVYVLLVEMYILFFDPNILLGAQNINTMLSYVEFLLFHL